MGQSDRRQCRRRHAEGARPANPRHHDRGAKARRRSRASVRRRPTTSRCSTRARRSRSRWTRSTARPTSRPTSRSARCSACCPTSRRRHLPAAGLEAARGRLHRLWARDRAGADGRRRHADLHAGASDGDSFVRTHADVKIPEKTKEYADQRLEPAGTGTSRCGPTSTTASRATTGRARRISTCAGSARWWRTSSASWSAAASTSIRATAREGYGSGRLRLVYECNPIAMVCEQAGGARDRRQDAHSRAHSVQACTRARR